MIEVDKTWKRAWQPTPVFLPGESHGQRSLVGYSPWDCKELDMTKHTPFNKYVKSNIGEGWGWNSGSFIIVI